MPYFGFDGPKPNPAKAESTALAEALFELIDARKALIKAKADVPNYTGQWNEYDYYANEQERYNRAADKFREVMGLGNV